MCNVRVYVGSIYVNYQVPNRGDHLLKVPRRLFPQSIHDEVDGNDPVNPVKHSEILCDACGEPITSEYVWTLILCRPWRCWGVVCEECRRKYHADKPAYIAYKVVMAK
jgi:formylmethanofuran dehydrogenase subunit E